VGLPEGFFSKGNAPVKEDDDEEEQVEEEHQGLGSTAGAGPSTATGKGGIQLQAEPKATGDGELDDFLASLSGPTNPISEPAEYAITKSSQQTQAQARKNVPRYKEVEPGQASYEAAPVRNLPEGQKEAEAEKAVEPEETEKERRERLAREEREEIVRRLEEEERAQ
jgi:zinc finger protein 830